MDSWCTYIDIDKQLVKDEKIQTKPINFLFGVYNIDETKNEDITKVALLEVKINEHKEYIKVAVMDLNRMDILLEYK